MARTVSEVGLLAASKVLVEYISFVDVGKDEVTREVIFQRRNGLYVHNTLHQGPELLLVSTGRRRIHDLVVMELADLTVH